MFHAVLTAILLMVMVPRRDSLLGERVYHIRGRQGMTTFTLDLRLSTLTLNTLNMSNHTTTEQAASSLGTNTRAFEVSSC